LTQKKHFNSIFYKLKCLNNLFVESEGIEPSSKQATKRLSTRLVFSWFSIAGWLKTLYLQLSFLSFGNKPKLFIPYVNFYDASYLTAVNQGFQETFSFPALQDVAWSYCDSD